MERLSRHWLLARHRGRAAVVSTHGDARSCRMAKRLAAVHGHARLDWVMLFDPVATDVMACWQALAHRVEAPQQGRSPIAIGQVLQSTGLAVQRQASALQPWFCGLGVSAGNCFPGLKPGSHCRSSNNPYTSRRSPERGLASSLLLLSGVGFCSMGLARGSSALKVIGVLGRVERWQSPVDRARLEIV